MCQQIENPVDGVFFDKVLLRAFRRMAGHDEFELVLSLEKRAVDLTLFEIQAHRQEATDAQAALAAEADLDRVFSAADEESESQLFTAFGVAHQFPQRSFERNVNNAHIIEEGCCMQG